MSPEAHQELGRLRQKYAADPNSLSLEELRRATDLMREGRTGAATATKAKVASKSKAPVDMDALDKELDGL